MFRDPDKTLHEALLEQAAGYAAMGWKQNLFDQFVLRNGHAGIAQRRPKGVRKQGYNRCFSNSIRALWSGQFPGYSYVEGKAASAMGFICHHAWLEDEAGNVLDLTWKDPGQCQYFGVKFDDAVVHRESVKSGVYGMLVPNEMCNIDLMMWMDPGMKQIIADLQSAA